MASTFKIILLAVTIATLGTFTATAQDAVMWKIDKPHTSVNFSINHFFSSVPGKFTDFGGKIRFYKDNLEGSTATFTVAINSVNTDNAKRDKHLQSKDFFDAKNYPKMTFQSTRFDKRSDEEYLIHGKLTIKDETKNIILPMKITGEMEHPMMEGTLILGVVIDTTIDRTDYGV